MSRKRKPSRPVELRRGVLDPGAAVLVPEVFLKALTVARNLGHRVDRFVTADFDMRRDCRPTMNVVTRATPTGCQITGHRAIKLPRLRTGILDALQP